MDFFVMYSPMTRQPEPQDLAELELVLRDQPEGEPLALWRYELPDVLTPRPEVWDAVVENDLSLTVGVGPDDYKAGRPVEWLKVAHEGGRIRITDASGAPAARCDNCNGLIRAADPACPRCSWQQWASHEGFLARPLPARRSAGG